MLKWLVEQQNLNLVIIYFHMSFQTRRAQKKPELCEDKTGF